MADQYRYRDDYPMSYRDQDRRYGRDEDRSGAFGRSSYGGGDNDRFDNRDAYRRVAIDETSRLISSDKVEGTRVYNGRGDRLGSIRNIMIEKRRGMVEYAVLRFGGFLGMGERYHPIPWQMLSYDERLEGYLVDLDERQLERAPSYRAGEEPRWDYGYSREVYGYYGLNY